MSEQIEYQEYRPLPWGDLKAALAARWKIAVGLAVLLAVGGSALAYLFPKYEATGFYYTPGWGLADYKKFRSEFGSTDVLDVYIREVDGRNAAAADLLRARAKDPRFWDTAIKPLYPITKKDAKEIFETTKDRESTAIIGLEMSVTGRSPAAARGAVLTLGDYVTETLLLTALQSWAVSGQAASSGEFLRAENEALTMRYSMEQTERRLAELRDLAKRYPDAQGTAARQVVTVDAQSAKFLPPLTQAVALEAGLAESREALRRMERRVKQLKMEAAFFDKAVGISKSAREGFAVLALVENAKQEVFKGTDVNDNAIKEVSNRFDLALKGFRDSFTIGFGFRSPVLEPAESERSPVRFALLGGVLGLLAGGLLILLPVLLRSLSGGSQPVRNVEQA